MTRQRQTRDLDGGSGGVFYQRVGERFSSSDNIAHVPYFLHYYREADTALQQAIAFVEHHRRTRAARLPVRGEHDNTAARLALAWIPQRWWKAVTGQQRHEGPAETVDHRSLARCVLSWVMVEL